MTHVITPNEHALLKELNSRVEKLEKEPRFLALRIEGLILLGLGITWGVRYFKRWRRQRREQLDEEECDV